MNMNNSRDIRNDWDTLEPPKNDTRDDLEDFEYKDTTRELKHHREAYIAEVVEVYSDYSNKIYQ